MAEVIRAEIRAFGIVASILSIVGMQAQENGADEVSVFLQNVGVGLCEFLDGIGVDPNKVIETGFEALVGYGFELV